MVGNVIIYTLEVIKYYLIMKNFLGFSIHKNNCYKVIGAIGIVLFSVYITITENNPLLLFLVYIYLEMFLLIKEKLSLVIVSTSWIMLIISILDVMFLTVIEFVTKNIDIEFVILDCMAASLTTVFLLLLVYVIKKKTKGEVFRITKIYYVYFTLLTLAEGMIIIVLKIYLDKEEGMTAFILILTCIVIMLSNLVMVMFLAVSNDGYKQRDEINRKYIKSQQTHYFYLTKNNEDIRGFRHDIISHIISIRKLNSDGDREAIDEYLNRIEEDIHMNDKLSLVGNKVVDAIANHVLYEAKRDNVKVEITGELGENCNVDAYDLCIIFANILSNAVEAAAMSGEKSVKLDIQMQSEGLRILTSNSFEVVQINEKGKLETNKKDKINHGYGLRNVYNSINKYDGKMATKIDGNKFYVDIFIPKNNAS